MTRTHEEYMEMALEIALKAEDHGDVPVGVIIVKNGEVIAQSECRVIVDNDLTAHSEVAAIRLATAALGKPYLDGCTMYDTFECCPMCCGAIMSSGIDTLVLGGRFEGPDRSYGAYSAASLLAMAGVDSRINLIEGVLRDRCNALMTMEKRNRWIQRIRGVGP